MSIQIKGNYLQDLRSADPTAVQTIIKPPPGSMSAPTIVRDIIPPLNTDIRFSSVVPAFSLAQHPGLAAISMEQIPEKFDWGHITSEDSQDILKKKRLIAKPGNQALCGSCWAISGAGIVGDNFVVSGVVDWLPNLSTTWSLACYPQLQCKGGNPAKLFQDISQGGIVSNHCVDYSWCTENPNCNGSAQGHFDQNAIMNLNSHIPNCGCYSKGQFYLYFIDPQPKSIFIGSPGIDEKNITSTVKKHIFTKGPAMGGFLVYKNFMKGEFTKVNGGVYLEKGLYGDGKVRFDERQISTENYKGSHAIAVIGWGVAKNILVDNNGKREDVPYWYCRNSWKDTWGERGYFKMAMYPWNQTSQFEKQIIITDQSGQRHLGGGFVLLSASKKPEKKDLPQIQQQFIRNKRIHEDSYYQLDPKFIPKATPDEEKIEQEKKSKESKENKENVVMIVLAILLVLAIAALILFLLRTKYIKF